MAKNVVVVYCKMYKARSKTVVDEGMCLWMYVQFLTHSLLIIQLREVVLFGQLGKRKVNLISFLFPPIHSLLNTIQSISYFFPLIAGGTYDYSPPTVKIIAVLNRNFQGGPHESYCQS